MGLTSDYTGLDIHRFRGVIQTAPIVDEHLRLHGATLAVGFGLGNGFLRSWVGVAGDWGVPGGSQILTFRVFGNSRVVRGGRNTPVFGG